MKLVRPMLINDAALVSSNVAEADYGAYNPATEYGLGDRVIVVAADVHLVYESLQAANTGHTPADEPAWWLEIGATNRWKMFDGSFNSQTTNADAIEAVLQQSERVNSVTLLNISAAEVQITVTDPVDGVVYDETESLVYDSGVNDWYAYFFEPIIRRGDFFTGDLPAYAAAEVAITLTAAGETVACGEVILGLAREIGKVEYGGASVGIRDFSVKDQNDFGDYTIVERAFSRRGSFNFWVDGGLTDELVRLLSLYRATPIVYVGIDRYRSTIVYGFFRDFSVVIAYPTHSFCNLEVEGLT